MKRISRITAFVLTALLFVQSALVVEAKGDGKKIDRLTQDQMKHAVVVPDGSEGHRSKGKEQVYRFASCNDTDTDSPCYFLVTDSNNDTFSNGANMPSSIAPLSSTATITCGINIYNTLGIRGAVLKENVGVTYGGTYGMTPVTLNWGDLGGTSVYNIGWSWTSFSGPTPTPNWGVQVSRTGTAYATAGGNLWRGVSGSVGTSTFFSIRLKINRYGWSCS